MFCYVSAFDLAFDIDKFEFAWVFDLDNRRTCFASDVSEDLGIDDITATKEPPLFHSKYKNNIHPKNTPSSVDEVRALVMFVFLTVFVRACTCCTCAYICARMHIHACLCVCVCARFVSGRACIVC